MLPYSAHQEDDPLPFKPGETGPNLGDTPGHYKCTNCRRDKPMSDFVGRAKPFTKTCHNCRHKANAGTLTKTVPKKRSPAKENAEQWKARLQPFQAKHYLETFGQTMPVGVLQPSVPTPPVSSPAHSPPASSPAFLPTAGSAPLSIIDSTNSMVIAGTLPATAFYPSYCPAEYRADAYPNCLMTANVAKAAGMIPHGTLPPTLDTLENLLKCGGSAYGGAASKKYADFIVAVAKANAAFLERLERMMPGQTSDEVVQAPASLKIIKPYVESSHIEFIEGDGMDVGEIGGLYSPLRQDGGQLEHGDFGFGFGEEVDLGGSWDVDSPPSKGQSSAETWPAAQQPTPGPQKELDRSWMQDYGEWAVSPTRVMAGSEPVQQEGMGLGDDADDEDFNLRATLGQLLGHAEPAGGW